MMVTEGVVNCPKCSGNLKYYDKVRRIVLTRDRKTRHVYVRRLRCISCNAIHRELPNYILPYKQYEAEIINDVIKELITSDTLGFENYPCEMTMIRWKEEFTT